jgi:hypothetical protein
MSDDDLIRRMDAVQACQVGPSDEWSRSTKSGYYQAATDCYMNILKIPPAALHDPVSAEPWQPIETAPKDCMIDIWLADGRRWCDCYYDRICDEWRTSRPSGRLLSIKACFVSHWMRSPAPPRALAGDKP